MDRIYQDILSQHIALHNEMAFIAGPRQVGKTTLTHMLCQNQTSHYLNWDVEAHQDLIMLGQHAVAEHCRLEQWQDTLPLVIFDEIHKNHRWKNFLKGFYDLYHTRSRCVVTGSAKLNIYQKQSDSLMGRYLLYRMHPLSLREILDPHLSSHATRLSLPQRTTGIEEALDGLWQHGGFPKPFLSQNDQFTRQWHRTRQQQLFDEEIRDINAIQNLRAFERFTRLFAHQMTQLMVYSNVANKTGVSVQTIQRWTDALTHLYHCFRIQPWSTHLARSLIKQPKYYLWDWSSIQDDGARWENLVASHCLKCVDFWNDMGLGDFGLYFLRTKDKEEVDFVLVRDGKPWILLEAKLSASQRLSPTLCKFHQSLNTTHAFQVVKDLPYVNRSILDLHDPTIIPGSNFLACLV